MEGWCSSSSKTQLRHAYKAAFESGVSMQQWCSSKSQTSHAL